jgi:heme A synthase
MAFNMEALPVYCKKYLLKDYLSILKWKIIKITTAAMTCCS